MYIERLNDVVYDRNTTFHKIFDGKKPPKEKMFFTLKKYTPSGLPVRVPLNQKNMIEYNREVQKNLQAKERRIQIENEKEVRLINLQRQQNQDILNQYLEKKKKSKQIKRGKTSVLPSFKFSLTLNIDNLDADTVNVSDRAS